MSRRNRRSVRGNGQEEAFKQELHAFLAHHCHDHSEGLYETELMSGMREQGWSFGTYDFRRLLRALVRDGWVREETFGPTGGGIKTMYFTSIDSVCRRERQLHGNPD